jgi:hypothetical protein
MHSAFRFRVAATLNEYPTLYTDVGEWIFLAFSVFRFKIRCLGSVIGCIGQQLRRHQDVGTSSDLGLFNLDATGRDGDHPSATPSMRVQRPGAQLEGGAFAHRYDVPRGRTIESGLGGQSPGNIQNPESCLA